MQTITHKMFRVFGVYVFWVVRESPLGFKMKILEFNFKKRIWEFSFSKGEASKNFNFVIFKKLPAQSE